jgi:hypothetical protein
MQVLSEDKLLMLFDLLSSISNLLSANPSWRLENNYLYRSCMREAGIRVINYSVRRVFGLTKKRNRQKLFNLTKKCSSKLFSNSETNSTLIKLILENFEKLLTEISFQKNNFLQIAIDYFHLKAKSNVIKYIERDLSRPKERK